jgi:zinc/manganese transport system ATP-binding protein
MDGPEDGVIESNRSVHRAAVTRRAAAARRRVEARLRAGTVWARAVLQHHFDGGYAPVSSRQGDVRHRAPALALFQITAGYHGSPAIENVTVEFPPGSMTAVIGPNGAGKTTLLKTLAGILQPHNGKLTRAARDIAYLPQSDEIDRSFPVSVGEFVALGRWRQFGVFRPAAGEAGDAAAAALDAVGLVGAAARPISALSLGQFRRVLFARLMLQDAGALLLDEPFAAVDAVTTVDLIRRLSDWHRDGRTIIAVLHDIDQVRAHFPRVVLLARQCIAAGDTAEVLTAENLARAGLTSRDGSAP